MKFNSTASGIAFVVALFLVFLILKLASVISWSWWWVTAPIWMPFAIGMIMLIISMIRVVWYVKRNNRKYNSK